MKNILLLEDLPEIRAWLKALVLQVFPNAQHLRSARACTTRSNWSSAIKFDLALIDLGLPDGSGVDVVAALRESQPEAQSVVVTIHDDDDHLFPALQAGAFGYLLKEQARELITEQLQRISQGEPPLSPSIARRVIAYFAAQTKPQARPQNMPHVRADRPRERGAAARRQGLHAARDRRAARPVAPHHRRLRQADLPQAQRQLARRGRARGAAPRAVPPLCTDARRRAAGSAAAAPRHDRPPRRPLAEKSPPQLLVDVDGVGYEVDVPMSTFYNLPALGERSTLLTHFVVREDAQLLFGFLTADERATFRALVKIAGVGPRTALAILSGLSVAELAQAVTLQESGRLVKVPGIGKKTAERLLLELKGKLGADLALPAAAADDAQADILQALIALGYSDREAAAALQGAAGRSRRQRRHQAGAEGARLLSAAAAAARAQRAADGRSDRGCASRQPLRRLGERWRTVLGVALAVALAGCATIAQPPAADEPAVAADDGSAAGVAAADDAPAPLELVPDAEPAVEPLALGDDGRRYEMSGVACVPVADDRRLYRPGLASWYGRPFHGRRTASGERYDMYALTAAHRTLPMPSYVRVRNPVNDRTVVVRINDRGPFHGRRTIDLSWAAAQRLGVQGEARVELRPLDEAGLHAVRWCADDEPAEDMEAGDATLAGTAQAPAVAATRTRAAARATGTGRARAGRARRPRR